MERRDDGEEVNETLGKGACRDSDIILNVSGVPPEGMKQVNGHVRFLLHGHSLGYRVEMRSV